MSLPGLFLSAIFEPRRIAFELATNDPLKIQERLLLKYIHRNKNTEFGKEHDFKSIKSVNDYTLRVPITNYEKFHKYIDRLARGEKNILTPDPVIFFGITSGTTNKAKLIPTTRYSAQKNSLLIGLWSYYIAKKYPDILEGKVLAIISPENEGYVDSGIMIGAESGHSYRTMPQAVASLFALPYEVFEIEDYESRHYAILRISMEQDVRTIATLNPNSIVLLCQKIERWQDFIIDDIKNGTLADKFSIKPEIRKAIEKRLKPNPKKAAELMILSEKKLLLPKNFWPNMRLIECWKGGMMKLYLEELGRYFGSIPKRDMGCVSTEARSSIPIDDNNAGGVLAIETNFFEFILKKDDGNNDKKPLLCSELRMGEEYYIIVTTASGLYRYNIDDIIKVTGFHNKTPIIEFVQKGLSAASMAGEKLYESQINDAIEKVMRKHNILIEYFCAVTKPLDGPAYHLLIEFSGETPDTAKAKDILSSIEEALCAENREYQYTRQAQLLKSPILKILKKGSFETFRIKRIKEGAKEGQFKAPQITCDPNYDQNFLIDVVVKI